MVRQKLLKYILSLMRDSLLVGIIIPCKYIFFVIFIFCCFLYHIKFSYFVLHNISFFSDPRSNIWTRFGHSFIFFLSHFIHWTCCSILFVTNLFIFYLVFRNLFWIFIWYCWLIPPIFPIFLYLFNLTLVVFCAIFFQI